MFKRDISRRVEKLSRRIDELDSFVVVLSEENNVLSSKIETLERELHPKTKKSNVTCDSATNLDKAIKRKIIKGWKLTGRKRVGKKYIANFERKV